MSSIMRNRSEVIANSLTRGTLRAGSNTILPRASASEMGWITSPCGWCRGQRHGLASRGYPALNADTLPRSGFVQSTLCGARHNVELGAAWQKTAKDTERDYLSVKLDDPSFPAPIYATLIEVEGQEGLQLIWSRPSRD